MTSKTKATTKAKAKPKRKPGEGKRGPRKGHGGRPKKTENRVHRTLQLCDVKEWPLLYRFSTGTSYTDRVRECLGMAANTRGDRAKIATRWKTRERKPLETPRERSIYLGAEEWEKLAKLFPIGSWADKARQLLELCAIVKRSK